MDIASIRKEYQQKTLEKDTVLPHPVNQFRIWFEEALNADMPDPNAMVLSTVNKNNAPSSRVVLLKNLSDLGFTFFTNYESRKGTELLDNPNAALNFFWPQLERQVRVEGVIQKVSEEESDDYFNNRPKGSRIGALISPQSQVIPNREFLENLQKEYNDKFKAQDDVPRPSHWGGYRLKPNLVEFWQGRPSRLHDRLLYTVKNGNWSIERIAP